MHEVGSFMRMYPAYTVQAVLDEYAVRFFALLDEGYRLQYQHYHTLARIGDLPSMSAEDRKQLYKDLEYASQHPSDILKTSSGATNTTDIKRMLGGN